MTEGQRMAAKRRAGKKAAANPVVTAKFGIPKGAKLSDKLDAVARRGK